MSRVVDERVVEMQFDNAQFEQNVKTSMRTINDLKQNLNFDGAAKGLENIEQASRNVDFGQMAAGVDALQNRFTTLGIVGMRVIQNLTDSAMRFVNKTFSFMTSGIIQGGIQRAMNLENAHFQLQGLLKDEEAVAAVMTNVNDSVDGTAYSLDAAAKVASQLAASGMRAGDEMFTSLRAVAGVAAMTNSEYESIGEIFTTVAGNGRLMGEQLLQLSSRGLNAAATLGEYLGKSEAEVREMVSKGKIDFKTFAAAMDDAFGEHAKKANETFTGSMSNIKAALARIGALFVSPLVVQNGPIVTLFNTLRERINDIKSTIGPLADQFTGSVNKMAESATAFLSRMNSEDRIQIMSNIVSTLVNVFSGLWSILKPIGQAFKDIFPAAAADNLISFTNKLKELTAKIKLSSTESKNLGDTFRGVFSVLKFVADAVITVAKGIGNLLSKLTGVRGGLLGITGAIGNWLTKVTSAAEKTGAFQAVVGGLSDYLGRCVESVKKFVGALNEKLIAPGFQTLADLLEKLWELVGKIGSKISDFFTSIGESFNGNSLNGAFTMMGMLILLKSAYRTFFDDWIPVIKRWKNLIQDGFLKTIESIVKAPEGLISAFNAVKRSLWTFNKSMKYDNIMKLAKALLVLAAAMLIISLIDTDKMAASFAAITGLVAELLGVIKLYDTLDKATIGSSAATIATSMSMIGLAIAITILASAMKKLSGLDLDEIAKGIGGITALIGVLVAAAKIMNKEEKSIVKFGKQMILMSVAVAILASACKKLGGLSLGELAKGVGGVLVLTMTFVSAAKILSKDEKAISKFAGQMLIMSLGIAIMAKVCKNLSGLSWEELAKGGAGLVAVTAVLVTAAKLVSKDSGSMLKGAGQMVLLSAAIAIMGHTLSNLSSLSLGGIGKGLAAMGGAVAILAIGLKAMNGTASGSAALLVAAAALAVLTPVLIGLGNMSLGSIAKSLITIAGAFTIIGLAGSILAPVVPAIIALGAAVGLIGVGCLAAGAGLQFFASGLAMLAAVTATAATSIVATLKVILLGILGMVPELASSLVTAIKSLIGVFVECIPEFSAGLLKLIIGILDSLAEYAPQITAGLVKLLIGLIDSLTTHLPEFVDSMMNFLVLLFNTIGDNITPLIESWASLFGAIFQGIASALGPIIESIVAPILEAVSNLIVGIVEAIGPYIPTICSAFTQITETICNAIVQITQAIAPFIPYIQMMVTSITQAIQTVANAIVSIVQQIAPIINSITQLVQQLGNSITQVLLGISEVIRSVGDVISQAFQGIADVITACGDAIRNSLEGIAEIFNSVFGGIAEVVISVGDSIRTVLDGIAGIIDSIGNAALNAGAGFEKLANGVKLITELNLVDMAASMGAVAVAIGKISSHSEELSASGQGMSQIANGATMSAQAFSTMAAGVTVVTKALSSIGSIASNVMSTLVSSVTNLFSCFASMTIAATTASTNVAASITSMASVCSSAANNMAKSFSAVGSALMTNIANGIRSGASSITATMNSLLTSLVTVARNKSSQFMSAGKTLATKLANGISSKKSSIDLAITSCLSGASTKIREYFTSFYNSGSYLVTGFANGISENSYKAAAKAEAMAEAAAEAARKALRINSPSKVFREIAYSIPEGFAQGIERMSWMSKDAAVSMAKDTIQGTSQTIARVAESISNDVDTQPTIRPVLDLSAISSGANDINDMLDIDPSIGLLSNVQSVSSMMNGRQNGKNDDVISAINKLRDKLDGVGNTYNTVNGITYDDGSNVTNAVETLVRYAKIGRRV